MDIEHTSAGMVYPITPKWYAGSRCGARYVRPCEHPDSTWFWHTAAALKAVKAEAKKGR